MARPPPHRVTALPHELTADDARGPALGLIVLQTDETVETEFRAMFHDAVPRLHVSRIESDPQVNADTLARMGPRLVDAARLLPPSVGFAAVGYACTSGATVIGSEVVAARVSQGCRAGAVTDPLAAVIAAARALGVGKIGFVTPYVADVSAAMRAALEAAGLRVAAFGSFEEGEEARVARIDTASVRAAALSVGGGDAEAVFLSCTNLATLDVIAEVEDRLGKPVISSNQALAWHMARLAGVEAPSARFGRLMARAIRSGT